MLGSQERAGSTSTLATLIWLLVFAHGLLKEEVQMLGSDLRAFSNKIIVLSAMEKSSRGNRLWRNEVSLPSFTGSWRRFIPFIFIILVPLPMHRSSSNSSAEAETLWSDCPLLGNPDLSPNCSNWRTKLSIPEIPRCHHCLSSTFLASFPAYWHSRH